MGKAANFIVTAYAVLIYIFLYAPILVLIIYSFNNSRLDPTWHGFTMHWYRDAFRDTRTMEALVNSIKVALASTAISTVLGTLAAIGMQRFEFSGKKLMEGLVYLSIIIPETVMGISLLALFVIVQIPLGLWTVILSHIAFSVSFVIIVVRARLAGIDPNLEEAARDLGASELQTLARITLPLALPGILSGALMAMTLSLDDFIITFFTAGPGSTTLPLRVFSMVKLGVSPEINAISAILMVITIGVLALSGGFRGIIKAEVNTTVKLGKDGGMTV